MGNILVVDDDVLIRKIASDILEDAGHTVFLAQNSVEGIDLLKEKDVDVVLLDVVLPTKSGFEMIPQIKDVDGDAVVIIMTAYASTDSAIEAIRRGAYDYIKKPVNGDELIHSVKRALERRRLVLENRSLVETLGERVRRLELFNSTSRAISSTLDLARLLEKIVNITESALDAEACSILLLDESTGDLLFTVASGDKADEVKKFRIKPGQGIAGWVLAHGRPLLISDAESDERFYREVDKKTGFRTRSMIAVPLMVKERIVGVIEVINKIDGTSFSEEDKETLTIMAGQIAVSIDNARMTEDLKRSREKIEQYSRNLEDMVRRRTAELEKANRDLKAAQAQLLQTEKLSSLGQMAAGVAHEINNPIGFVNSNLVTLGDYLNSIMDLIDEYEGMVKAIKRKDFDSFNKRFREIGKLKEKIKFDFIKEDIEKLVRESRNGAYRVFKIVRDLREFSRADDAERKFVDIHKNLDSTLRIVWNELKCKVEVVKDYGDIPEIECLPAQLNQAFLNLFLNAAQAIEKNGTMKIRTYAKGDKVFIEISDTGCGIPEENMGKIFDPFFTTKEPGEGTGLGLFIVYSIIKKHNGAIRVKSRVGKGTTFIVEVPTEMKPEHGFDDVEGKRNRLLGDDLSR